MNVIISHWIWKYQSRDLNTIIGDSGDPIGMPKIYLKIVSLNLKKVELKIRDTAIINSFKGIFILYYIWNFIVFFKLITAKSIGMFVYIQY